MLALAPKAEATTTPNEFLVPLDRRADRDLTRWTAELDAQDRQLAQEKANLAKLKSSLQQESTNLADDRKVLAEQFALLGAARAEWQEVEGRTVAELEELARSLRLKEEDMAAREDRLVKADARRREEGHDLWRLRLKLEAWQSKLSTVSRLWHSERERREQDLALREKSLALRETALQQAFDQCERSRAEEHERLRTEIRLWADDRIRLKQAAENFDTQAREAMSEIARHAARAMVAEELLSEASSKGKGATRRFEVLRKRWEKVFVQKLNEIDRRRVLIGQELTRLDDRYEEIHRSLTELAERESEFNRKVARIEMTANRVVAHRLPASTENQSDAIAALRDEIERMAHVLLEAGVPEQPDEMLPLAAEEIEEGPEPVMLPFAFHSRAA